MASYRCNMRNRLFEVMNMVNSHENQESNERRTSTRLCTTSASELRLVCNSTKPDARFAGVRSVTVRAGDSVRPNHPWRPRPAVGSVTVESATTSLSPVPVHSYRCRERPLVLIEGVLRPVQGRQQRRGRAGPRLERRYRDSTR